MIVFILFLFDEASQADIQIGILLHQIKVCHSLPILPLPSVKGCINSNSSGRHSF
jgi:hypothetical protein